MVLRLLTNPLETLLRTTRNESLQPQFRNDCRFGASVTLAGYGYPFTQIKGPPVPLETTVPFNRTNADVWWSEVTHTDAGKLMAAGHRLGDFIGYGADLPTALTKAYENIRLVRSPGSYYRTDIGQSLWPPGNE